MGYKVPNWAQAQIARAAGLDPDKVAVQYESESSITFLQFMPRCEVNVSKTTGRKMITEDPCAARKLRSARQETEQLMIQGIKKGDAPTGQSQGTADE